MPLPLSLAWNGKHPSHQERDARTSPACRENHPSSETPNEDRAPNRENVAARATGARDSIRRQQRSDNSLTSE
jgi:hypothetical protein